MRYAVNSSDPTKIIITTTMFIKTAVVLFILHSENNGGEKINFL